MGTCRCKQAVWYAFVWGYMWYDKKHVAHCDELIVPLPGCDDHIIFPPLVDSHRGTFFFILLITTLNRCGYIQHVCIDLNSSMTQSHTHIHTYTCRLTYLEMISETQGNVAQSTPLFWHWEAALCSPPPPPPPLRPVSGALNASPDPDQSIGSTTCWSKSSIDLKQLCAVEHYILIRVAWWL